MEKIKIDKDLCIGCGACAAYCPDTFEIGDDMLAEVVKDEVTDEVIEAAESCPTDVIKINKNNKENKEDKE